MCEQGKIPSRTFLSQISKQLYFKQAQLNRIQDFVLPVLDSSRASAISYPESSDQKARNQDVFKASLLCFFIVSFKRCYDEYLWGISYFGVFPKRDCKPLCMCLRLRLINQFLEEKIHKNSQSRGLKWPEVSEKKKRRDEFTGIEEGFNSGGAGSEVWNRVYMIAPVKKFGRVRLSTSFPWKQIWRRMGTWKERWVFAQF